MDSPSQPPVSQWISDLKVGDQAAARQLWDAYFERLVRVARQKMGTAPRRVVDEEDIALSAFKSLCRGAEQGNFAKLEDRDDLWQLLVTLAHRKAVDQIRRQTSQKRGSGNVRGHSIAPGLSNEDGGGFEQFLAADPTPEFVATLEEERQRLFDSLRDETVRSVAQLRLEGFSNQEIADHLEISLRSVERKLGVIRQTWVEELD